MTWCIGARSSSRTRWTTSIVIKKGVGVGDRIVLEGIRQVRDGEKVEYEFRVADEVIRKRTEPRTGINRPEE